MTRELVISLIQLDLKHNQLTKGFTKLGLDPNVRSLEIVEVVARLMGVEKVMSATSGRKSISVI